MAETLGGLVNVPAEGLDRARTFFELGATSLLLVRAHRELRANRASELTVLDLFAHPLDRGLAAHVVDSTVKTVGESTVDSIGSRGRERAGRPAPRGVAAGAAG